MKRVFALAPIAAGLSGAAIALVVLSPPVAADAPVQQGWWAAYNPGANVPMAGSVAPPSPDVPAKGLLVEGGPNGPSAYAGLVYFLADSAKADTVTLSVASQSATNPTSKLQMCRLQSAVIIAEQGGPMSDAPAYDTNSCVTASPDSSDATYQFKVTGMDSNGTLAVAVLPTSPTDRVVFNQPDANSLAVTAPSTNLDTNGGVGPFPGIPSPGGSPVSAFLPSVEPTPAGSGAASAAPQPASSAPTPRESFPSFRSFSNSSERATPLAVALVTGGLVGGALLWAYAGRRRPEESLA